MEPGSSRPAQAGIHGGPPAQAGIHGGPPAQAGIHGGPPAQAGIHGGIDVIVHEPAWRRWVPRAVAIAERAARASAADGTIVLAGDRAVRRLNARHRGRNKPTNVLTYEHPAPEIILALGVVRREAAAQGRTVGDHLAHLVVHGALHLRGLDHHHPGEARRMEMAETRILHRMGVPNPWKRT
jgi:probable rRNA maturation factor